MERSRIVISALRGGSGKTILSIGIIAAWKNLGKRIAPFKKGPDYIDAGWLALAAGRPCYNLDPYLISADRIISSFMLHSDLADCAVIEGNRGLFDGIDLDGTTSTAELAKVLNAPVVLCVDCTKVTRTMAAVISGCIRFDPDVHIQGVILNRVAGSRHERILRNSIEHYCEVPVLGAVPKLSQQQFPERHMGLVPTPEHGLAADAVEGIRAVAEKYLNLPALERIADRFRSDPISGHIPSAVQAAALAEARPEGRPRIGIVQDSAFQFYYPDNIEALAAAGAETRFVSPLENESIPPVDALYIGGGFPETHARELAANEKFKSELRSLAQDGLPIYAECGGLMYLARELVLDNTAYPMVGVLPVVFGLSERPQGHGYTVVRVDRENPFFEVGFEWRGHEFHYSKVFQWMGSEQDLVFDMKRGAGLWKKRDGLIYKNVLATYSHLHALGVPGWAEALVRSARLAKK